MDRNLALEVVRVTEAAALSASKWIGRGDEKAADAAAVNAMRQAFNLIDFCGTVVIGEGERDEAPMLYIGEKVGTWRAGTPLVDIALDPLEGTTITARGDLNAISVVALAENGCFLHAPDTYMSKIAVGSAAKGALDLSKSVTENLRSVASALKKKLNEMTVIILDRERHKAMIQEIRDCECRVILIRDGDVAASIATALEGRGIDMLIGIGGAPEGVIAAAALKCLDGDMQGKLVFRNDEEKERALKMGIRDLEKIYSIDELARGHVMFAATGVTDGQMLEGIRTIPGGVTSNSVVMRSETGTVRFMKSIHKFKRPSEF